MGALVLKGQTLEGGKKDNHKRDLQNNAYTMLLSALLVLRNEASGA